MNPEVAMAPSEFVRPVFRRELTPTWLWVTALLAGHRPPDTEQPLRVLDLRCRTGLQAAVVAACHPDAEVWACDNQPSNVERAELLAREVQLKNLTVLETSNTFGRGSLPSDVDIALLDDVVSTMDDAGRDDLAALLARHVSAGGLIAVVYRTSVGWAEVLPLRRLALLLASTGDRTTAWQMGAVVTMLERLLAGGARYVLDRPAVAALVDEIASIESADLAGILLTEHLQPMSLVDVAEWLAPTGATFVGSGRLGGGDDSSQVWLMELLRDTQDVFLREALSDLAFRPSFRVDVFRRGSATLSTAARRSLLMDLELVGLAVQPTGEDATDAVVAAIARLDQAPARVADLIADPAADTARGEQLVRSLLDHGFAHPRSAGWGARDAGDQCGALNRRLAEMNPSTRWGHVAAPAIGSAVHATDDDFRVLAGAATAARADDGMALAESLAQLGIVSANFGSAAR